MTDLPVETPLDAAGDGAPFYNVLAGAELFVLLTQEPTGDQIAPEIFDTDDGRFVLAFDREDRLAQFVGGPAPFAALSGRNLAQMLSGQGIGIALNPEVAPSAQLLPPAAVDWLHHTLASEAQEVGARPQELYPPDMPETLVRNLDAKLAGAVGLARAAYLVAAQYDSGARGHILAFVGATSGTETALTQAVHEALTFADLDAATLDVAFFDAADDMAARLAKVGLRFDLPQPMAPSARTAPGSDPDRPPKLK